MPNKITQIESSVMSIVWLPLICSILLSTNIHEVSMAQEFDPTSTGRLAVSDSGCKVAMASNDNRVRVWSSESRKLLHVIDVGKPGLSVAMSLDGKQLLTGVEGDRSDPNEHMTSTIACWDINGDAPILLWETKVIGGCQGLSFSKSRDWVVAICIYSRLVFLDRQTGHLRRVWTEHGNGFWQFSLSFDDATLVTAGQATRVWDLKNHPLPMQELPIDYWPPTHESGQAQRFDPWSGAMSVSASTKTETAYLIGYYHGNSGRAWDCARLDFSLHGKFEVVATELGASDGIMPTCLALAPDDSAFVVGFDQGFMELRSADGSLLKKGRLTQIEDIRSISFLNRGTEILVATEQGASAVIVDASNLNQKHRLVMD